MKKCGEIQAELSAYIDNELPTVARAAVEKHVQDCGICRARLAELKELAAGVLALPSLQPETGFLTEVRRRIARDAKPQPKLWQDYLFRPLWLKVPLEAVAVIAIVLFVMRTERSVNDRAPSHRPLMPAEEPAATSAALEVKPRSTEKLAPNRLVGNAAPSPADPASGEVVVVHAKDFDDARNRIQQLASTMNGRVMVPPPGKASTHMLLVELPAENVETFKSRLQNAKPLTTTAQSSVANAPNSVAGEVGHLERTPARVTVQIQILAPAD